MLLPSGMRFLYYNTPNLFVNRGVFAIIENYLAQNYTGLYYMILDYTVFSDWNDSIFKNFFGTGTCKIERLLELSLLQLQNIEISGIMPLVRV